MGLIPTPKEYRLLVENSPVMIWRAGLDAKCDYFNETWLAFTGRTLQQEMGDGWAEGVHADDLERCVKHYLGHFQRREAFEMEYRLRRHDGEFRWIFDRGVPYTNDEGEFAGFIGSCVDVHERREAQDTQQTHSMEQLALARDFEKWILAIVSHDIRDPLGSIQLAAHAMRMVPDTPPAVKKQTEFVIRGVKRIENIVGDLLDLSREREGRGITLQPKAGDIRSMCQEIIDELAAISRDREITFDCEADGRGVWDETRILQAISNLTANAVQHGEPGSPVHVRLTGDDRNVAVEVRNQGAIPEDVMPRIFEPFRSGRHHGSRGEGLGLGLFIAKAIARAHGGALQVDSSQGNTMFRLTLPRRVPGSLST